MVDIAGLPIGVRLNDQCAGIPHQLQLFGLLHSFDFRMGQEPVHIEAVDQKVRALIAQLYAAKYFDAQFLADAFAFLVVGEVKTDAIGIGQVAGNVDVAVQKMVGDEYTVISQFFVEGQLLLNGCKGAFADDEATLASIRAEGFKGGELVVKGNMQVGNFEKKVAELYGIGVQVANADDSKLTDNTDTLCQAGK